jgi:hypothetical protein
MNCDICQNNELKEDPALLYVDSHKFVVCDECEMLLSVINETLKKLKDTDDEQSI